MMVANRGYETPERTIWLVSPLLPGHGEGDGCCCSLKVGVHSAKRSVTVMPAGRILLLRADVEYD